MALSGEITALLAAAQKGDSTASAELTERVYHELHRMAEAMMRRERPDHTLQATALVNEAYLRMLNREGTTFQNRAHFFAAAATAMRRVLVDHARSRATAKRTGGRRVEMDELFGVIKPNIEDLIALDTALTELQEMDTRKSRLVEMRYFGGLTEEEAAEVLGVSLRTVKRDWSAARAWLQAQLRRKLQ